MPKILVPPHLVIPSTIKSMEEWSAFLNSIYTGNIEPGALPPDIYDNEQLYGEAVKVISEALGLRLNLLPGDANFIENHIYNSVISYLAQQLFLEQESITTIQEAFDNIFAQQANSQRRGTLHEEIVKIIANQIKQKLDIASHKTSFTINGFTIEGKLNKKIYTLHNKNGTTEDMNEDTLLKVLERNLSHLINKESDVYKSLIPMVNNLSIVATISRYGAYKQALIDALYDPITRNPFDIPLLRIYAAMAPSSIPQPYNFDMFSPGQKKLYALLGDTAQKTEEHILARKFALHAARDQDSEKITDPSIRLVNSFKGEAGQAKRVQFLVIEMLRNRVKPKDLAKQYGDFAELKLAAALYSQCLKESKNIKMPTRADLNDIELRIKKGEISTQDLRILMRHANRSVFDTVAKRGPISFMGQMQEATKAAKRRSVTAFKSSFKINNKSLPDNKSRKRPAGPAE